jgi:5-methylcytosine-specific restriction protein A
MPYRPKVHHPRHQGPRPSAARRGYDARWRKARLAFLHDHPFCSTCEKKGVLQPATVVDHVLAHRGNMTLFWDPDNWQGLCKECHNRKTAKGE